MFIPEDGKVPTEALAQLIRQKSHFSFTFSGRSMKLLSNGRFHSFSVSLDKLQS